MKFCAECGHRLAAEEKGPEEKLGLDEVERIAKEYVQREENVEDVEVESTVRHSRERQLVWVVKGKARKHTRDNVTFRDIAAEERPFTLYVSDKDRKITGYARGDWIRKNAEQAPSESSSSATTLVYPEPYLLSEPETTSDMRLKYAKSKNEEAEAELKREKAKYIRDKRRMRGGWGLPF